MAKSPDAFRTISEVADWLGVEAHVLRFWETKFSQVKPVKRAGGRRYYRPSDMTLLGGIRHLLHDEGMTIRGVQKILREKGIGHVSGMSPELRFDGVELAAPERPRRTPRTVAPEVAPRPPATAGGDDDSPSLPFDLPSAAVPETPATPTAEPEPAPGPTDGGNGPLGDGAPTEKTPRDTAPVPLRLRSGAARLDPAAATDVLARARALVERLRNTPE